MAPGAGLGVAWGLLLLLSGALARERSRMVGAPMDASLDDEQARRALRFAVDLYNRGSNDAYSSRVAEVIRVQKQIVAGIKYIFTVKMGRTSCRNSETVAENCAFFVELGQAKESTCTFEVVIVPWMNQVKLVKNDCQ